MEWCSRYMDLLADFLLSLYLVGFGLVWSSEKQNSSLSPVWLSSFLISDFMALRSTLWLTNCSFRLPAISRVQSKLSVDLLHPPGAHGPSLITPFTPPVRAVHTLILVMSSVDNSLSPPSLIFSLISGVWFKLISNSCQFPDTQTMTNSVTNLNVMILWGFFLFKK